MNPGEASSTPRAATATAAPLRVVGVHKSYRLGERQIPALRGVDLHLPEPGFFAIMGQSGSGKSTLLHLLAALDRPDRGEIYVGGEAVHNLPESQATEFRRKRVGLVFQQFNLIPTLTARENIELPGLLGREDQGWLRARSAELMERLGLTERAEHRPDALSGGEQQRVAIARALLYTPPVVFADEPTGNLDSATSALLWRLLAELAREQHITMVMVTHEPAAAVNCERIFVLQDGAVKGTISTEGLDASGVAACYQQSIRAA